MEQVGQRPRLVVEPSTGPLVVAVHVPAAHGRSVQPFWGSATAPDGESGPDRFAALVPPHLTPDKNDESGRQTWRCELRFP